MVRTPLVALMGVVLALAGCGRGDKLSVGAKNFTEQLILGEIIAQHLEQRLGKPVERRFNLGGALLAQNALTSGQIDILPEYTGTALTAVLKLPPNNSPAQTLAQVRDGYRALGLEWLDGLQGSVDHRGAGGGRGREDIWCFSVEMQKSK